MNLKNCMLIVLLIGIFSTMAYSQEKRRISGRVVNEAGEGIPGVTITLKGTGTSVVSSSTGDYVIDVNSSNDVLELSSVGYERSEVTVGTSARLNLSLKQVVSGLTEVVVTALGVSRQQKALGYATTTIKAEDIVQAGSPNFASALYGKAPGVRIGSTPGGATSAVNITIRGINSITGKNQPLIVLDGVPIRNEEVNNGDYWGDQRLRGNGLLDINPEDIDNISILKGASAAALYGSEAVNGVILITTKSGAKGRKGFSIDVNTNYSIDKVAYLPR